MALLVGIVGSSVLAGPVQSSEAAIRASRIACGTTSSFGYDNAFGSQGSDKYFDAGDLCLTNGRFKAVFQKDGNLVIYKNSNQPVWATNSSSSDPKTLSFQKDANVVIYNIPPRPSRAWWSTGTQGHRGSFDLVMQADGNLVIYQRSGNSSGAIWASGTAGA
ncbi:hypothetical protein GRS96_11495 [Rathayibacter sp. VKM Ac-2803]|uniref:hypothetical protein n=1 Tax=unclassified Rathayibacter TaxID=2609250 RepID=UPI0013577461|nr:MULTISPECIES: hypothetical protein [unclassified Rathayibacter]MWV49894.1 hypothetical protein [Rathayibacter sp. VKM Ac-2803]MWV58025.1 hypothetical protein [Rathayibacter sp. VKM Ac-2754]